MNPEQRLEAFRQFIATQPPQQLIERMGIRLMEIHYGRVVGTMPVIGNQQPYGLLHGGASCVLAETLASVAAALQAFPDGRIACVDMNATHHRPVRRGLVTGVCTPLYEGRSLATHQIVLTDDEGRLVCTARLTCAVLGRVSGTEPGSERSSSNGEEGASVSAQSLLTWVLTATTRLLPGQSQTLAVLVAAALRCERPNLAQVGRGLLASVGSPDASSDQPTSVSSDQREQQRRHGE